MEIVSSSGNSLANEATESSAGVPAIEKASQFERNWELLQDLPRCKNHRCGKEALRLIDGLCLVCYERRDAVWVEKKEKAAFKRALQAGDPSAWRQLRKGA